MRGAVSRREVAQALWNGEPHPAYVFFELLDMRWELSADGSELTCVVPTAQLGNLQDVRAGLGWVNHWVRVSSYLKYRESAALKRRQAVKQSKIESKRGDSGEETT